MYSNMIADLSHIVSPTCKGFDNCSISISVGLEIPTQWARHGPELRLGDFAQALISARPTLHGLHKGIRTQIDLILELLPVEKRGTLMKL